MPVAKEAKREKNTPTKKNMKKKNVLKTDGWQAKMVIKARNLLEYITHRLK